MNKKLILLEMLNAVIFSIVFLVNFNSEGSIPAWLYYWAVTNAVSVVAIAGNIAYNYKKYKNRFTV